MNKKRLIQKGQLGLISKLSKYNIKHLPGYQLKSFIRGNPLEKQLSKEGLINVANIRNTTKNASNIEKKIIDKVLSEQFAGQKEIDYNALREAIQKELITYNRVKGEGYETYGLNRLNYDPDDGVAKTYLFEADRIPIGNDLHFTETTLGHSRVFHTPKEPDILYILESQSDAAQNRELIDLNKWIRAKFAKDPDYKKRIEDKIKSKKKDIQYWEDMLQRGINQYGEPLSESGIHDITNNFIPSDKLWIRRFQYRLDPSAQSQADYLLQDYERKQLQENMRLAAQHNFKSMRYPTEETAAKIEGFNNVKTLIDYDADKVDELFAYLNNHDKRMFPPGSPTDLAQELYKYDVDQDLMIYLSEPDEYSRKLANDIKKSMKGTYKPEHQRVLRHYSGFPKMARKIFAEPRTVIDPKGNSWFELDIPANYLDQEWVYKKGGKMNKKKLIPKNQNPSEPLQIYPSRQGDDYKQYLDDIEQLKQYKKIFDADNKIYESKPTRGYLVTPNGVGRDNTVYDNKDMLPNGYNIPDQERYDQQAQTGAKAVNRATESFSRPVLEGLKFASFFTPPGKMIAAIDGAHGLYETYKEKPFKLASQLHNTGLMNDKQYYTSQAINAGTTLLNTSLVIPFAKAVPKNIDFGLSSLGNKAAKGRLVGRMMKNPSLREYPTDDINPKSRYLLGDVEINNPQLSYRQGTDIAPDFMQSNKVALPEALNYGDRDIVLSNGKTINLGKTFNNPMFAQGRLWFGIPDKTGDLLVTAESLQLATKSSNPVKSIVNGTFDVRNYFPTNVGSRRVMMTPDQLNKSNTMAYRFIPGYGYKVFNDVKPKTSYSFFENNINLK